MRMTDAGLSILLNHGKASIEKRSKKNAQIDKKKAAILDYVHDTTTTHMKQFYSKHNLSKAMLESALIRWGYKNTESVIQDIYLMVKENREG